MRKAGASRRPRPGLDRSAMPIGRLPGESDPPLLFQSWLRQIFPATPRVPRLVADGRDQAVAADAGFAPGHAWLASLELKIELPRGTLVGAGPWSTFIAVDPETCASERADAIDCPERSISPRTGQMWPNVPEPQESLCEGRLEKRHRLRRRLYSRLMGQCRSHPRYRFLRRHATTPARNLVWRGSLRR
jgi:hypothetical protein